MISGRCLCGSVTYRAASAPIVVRACWCRLCQYIGAGSGTVNACFAREGFIIQGELGDHMGVADSGARMHRRFCRSCGTHLFSEAEPRPHLIFVRVGTLDDPEAGRPQMTIWTSQAPSWACIAEDLPRVEAQPPPAG
ncbi:MAG: GFA family protein [Caulobacteraceae bacterium]|nr:GFA family protein [Caulobacteraceae bacterium]